MPPVFDDKLLRQAITRVTDGFEAFADAQGVYIIFDLHFNVDAVLEGLELATLISDSPGQGDGSRILNELLQRADKEGVDVYLRASSPRNEEFYARFGFEKRHKGMVRRFTGNIPCQPLSYELPFSL